MLAETADRGDGGPALKTLLITGGAGFIGCNLVRLVLAERKDVLVVNLDALTYAGNLESLVDVESSPSYRFEKVDIADREAVRGVFAKYPIDAVAHLAAESHVDRSILDPVTFIRTNVLGTQNLIDAALKTKVARFLQVSTDEVYGSLGKVGRFEETSPLKPSSPYSASKAAADLLVGAACHTYGFPGLITRCSNNYGPYQFPEKLIPLMILNAVDDQPLPVYGDGRNVRDWLHVEDHARALLCVLEQGRPGEIYNIGGGCEQENLTVVRLILKVLGKDEKLIRFVEDRPGHDRRYAIDATKIERELLWRPRHPFEEGLRETIDWYRAKLQWTRRVRSGAYREYYQRQYGRRLAEP